MKKTTIDHIIEAKVNDDQESLTVSLAAGAEVITFQMNVRLASELIDTLAARNDEIMVARSQQAPGLKAGAYRTCQKADVEVDVTNTMALLMFDRGQPHQVGVAIPVAGAQEAGRRLEQLALRALKQDRKQKRQ